MQTYTLKSLKYYENGNYNIVVVVFFHKSERVTAKVPQPPCTLVEVDVEANSNSLVSSALDSWKMIIRINKVFIEEDSDFFYRRRYKKKKNIDLE